MWAVCDLALGILIAKALPLELGKYPPNVKISDMYFTPSEDPEFLNNQVYLPSELVQQQKRSTKASFPLANKKVKLDYSLSKEKYQSVIPIFLQTKSVTSSEEDSEEETEVAELETPSVQPTNDVEEEKNGKGNHIKPRHKDFEQ